MFLRPPRFGKSLLKSTLHSYYDFRQEKDFDHLFGDLYIGKNPTPLRNRFYVLPLDFSIDVNGGDPKLISAALRDNINRSVKKFSQVYQLPFEINVDDAFDSLCSLMHAVSLSDNPRLLILIDEYDRFANKLMLENVEAYGVSGDRLSSPIRTFYEVIKEGVPGLKDYRSITFGIAPIALADAYGANNIRNITFTPRLADACGFTKEELAQALEAIGVTGEDQQVALEVTKRFYNGYRFDQDVLEEQMVYNTTLCLSFLQKYQSDADFRDIVKAWKAIPPEKLIVQLKVRFHFLRLCFCPTQHPPDAKSFLFPTGSQHKPKR